MADAYASIITIGILMGLICTFPPYVHYWSMKKESKKYKFNNLKYKLPPITILLPVRNESKVIESKLQEIIDVNKNI